MSVSSETAQFDLIVNDGQAKRALAETRTSAQQLGGGLGSVVEGLDQIGGKSGKDATNAVRSLSFALGGASGVGAEFLSVIGDMADVLTGGGLVVGLVLVGSAVAKLVEGFNEIEAGARGFDEAVQDMNATLERATTERIAKMTEGVASLRTELKNFGKDARQVSIDDLQAGIATDDRARPGLADALERARAQLSTAQTRANILRGTEFQEDAQEARDLVSALETRLRVLDARVDSSRSALEAQTRAAGELDAREANKASDEKARAAAEQARAARRAETARNTASLFAQDTLDSLIANRLHDDAVLNAIDKKAEDARTRIEKQAADARVALAKKEGEEKRKLFDQQVQDYTGYATAALNVGVAASQQLLDDVIFGQEQAAEKFAAFVFKQAGTAVIGTGIKTTAEGVGQLAATHGAIGGDAVAVGLGLIGLGVGLGGIGSAITGSIGGAGGGGSPLDNPARTDPGVAPRGASAAATGPAVVNVHFQYGLGPAPEKMARDLASAMDFARARGILVRDGRGTGRLQ